MPRVEYTLSFENYLEMTQGRRDAPRMRAATISAATGFGLLVLGYGWLRVMPESWSILGGVFLGFGLLATVLAAPLGLFTKRKDARPDIATLRAEYKHSVCLITLHPHNLRDTRPFQDATGKFLPRAHGMRSRPQGLVNRPPVLPVSRSKQST